MEHIKKFFAWLIVQPLVSKILFLIASVCIVAMLLFSSSCGVARTGISGNRVVDKNVKDSTHYEVVLEK